MHVITISLGAALAFALAAVLQQHAAAAQPAEHSLHLSLLWRLAKRPLWRIGIAASAVGTLLQLLALWRGSLVTVQPVLVCGLLFALPINAVWVRRRRPERRELGAAAAVCAGLTTFLLATDPGPGHASASPIGWVIVISSLLAAAIVLVGCSFGSKGAFRSCLLASAAGLLNALSAAFVKGVARDLGHYWSSGLASALWHAVTGWEVYAFGVTLVLVALLVQSAFQAGPIRWSLPALTALNPVASVIIGTTVLGEHIRSSPIALLGTTGGLGLVVAGIAALSSSSLLTSADAQRGDLLNGSDAPVLAEEANAR